MTLFSMFDKINSFVTENYKENQCMWNWSLGDEERQDMEEKFEDIKGVIIIRISKNRQDNGQQKKYKRTNNDLQYIHVKLKIE